MKESGARFAPWQQSRTTQHLRASGRIPSGTHFDHLGTQGPKMNQNDHERLLSVGSFGGRSFSEILLLSSFPPFLLLSALSNNTHGSMKESGARFAPWQQSRTTQHLRASERIPPGTHFDHLGAQGPKMRQSDHERLLLVGSFGGRSFSEIHQFTNAHRYKVPSTKRFYAYDT